MTTTTAPGRGRVLQVGGLEPSLGATLRNLQSCLEHGRLVTPVTEVSA